MMTLACEPDYVKSLYERLVDAWPRISAVLLTRWETGFRFSSSTMIWVPRTDRFFRSRCFATS